MMRESVAHRRDIAVSEDNRENSTPVDPAGCGGLGGEFTDSESVIYSSTNPSMIYSTRGSTSGEDETDNDLDSDDEMVIYNTRL